MGKKALQSDVIAHVLRTHPRPEDFDEGNLLDRVASFGGYHKSMLDLDTVDLDEFALCEVTIEEYRLLYLASNGQGPELIYDPVNCSMIDGIHRANACRQAGYRFHEAFIGDPQTYEPMLDEHGLEDDEVELTEDDSFEP
jgi:hypothetical protein